MSNPEPGITDKEAEIQAAEEKAPVEKNGSGVEHNGDHGVSDTSSTSDKAENTTGSEIVIEPAIETGRDSKADEKAESTQPPAAEKSAETEASSPDLVGDTFKTFLDSATSDSTHEISSESAPSSESPSSTIEPASKAQLNEESEDKNAAVAGGAVEASTDPGEAAKTASGEANEPSATTTEGSEGAEANQDSIEGSAVRKDDALEVPAVGTESPGEGSAGAVGEPEPGRRTFTKIKSSHILEEVLENKAEEEALPDDVKKRLRYPMALDLILGLGLLVSVGGFTIGLFNMYLVHAATESINKANYEAAIAILRGAPMSGVFAMPGSEPEELLSQALYLDSVEKVKDGSVEYGLEQLRLIKPGSKFFAVAQHVIDENTEQAEMLLEGGTEHIETAPVVEKKSAYEKALQSEE